jgi:hypothetical protein
VKVCTWDPAVTNEGETIVLRRSSQLITAHMEVNDVPEELIRADKQLG